MNPPEEADEEKEEEVAEDDEDDEDDNSETDPSGRYRKVRAFLPLVFCVCVCAVLRNSSAGVFSFLLPRCCAEGGRGAVLVAP